MGLGDTKVISVLNAKGGVGKSTCCVNLAAGLVKRGKKILLIDCDTQSNLTTFLTDEDIEDRHVGSMMMGEYSFDDICLSNVKKNIDLLPANVGMMDLELKLYQKISRETILDNSLRNAHIDNVYDYIIIDNPPSFSFTVINSLFASDYFMVPCSATYISLRGIRLLYRLIEKIKGELNHDIKNIGYLLTMFDKRKTISADVENILRTKFGKKVFKNKIRINSKLESSQTLKKTIFEIKDQKGMKDYYSVSKEFISRLEDNHKHLKKVS